MKRSNADSTGDKMQSEITKTQTDKSSVEAVLELATDSDDVQWRGRKRRRIGGRTRE
jgi:hypothetical protein